MSSEDPFAAEEGEAGPSRPETAASQAEPEEEEVNDGNEEGAEEDGGEGNEGDDEEDCPESRGGSATSRGSARPESSSSRTSSAFKRTGSAKSGHSVSFVDTNDERNLLEEDGGTKEGFCTKFIAGMWATRQMLRDENDQRLFVKITLRELILYCTFMVVITYQTYAQYNPMYYTYTDMMKSLFKKQLDVTNMQRFWDFAEGDLLDGIYWEKWYNTGDPNTNIRCPDGSLATKPCNVSAADRNIMYENRVLGLPRIRQLKVTNDSCIIDEYFTKAIKVCFAPYNENNEDMEIFLPPIRQHTHESAWVYHTQEALVGSTHWGQIATYSGAGYVQTLDYTKDVSKLIMSELKEGLWITQGTRFVSVDFTVYNVNVNLFCVVKLTFEFPATGGVIPDQQFTTVRLLKYVDSIDYLLMATECIFAIFILYYMIEEALEMKAKKISYFFNLSNLVDLGVIVISAMQIFYSLWNTWRIDGLIDGLLEDPFTFTDFSELSSNSNTLTILSAWNIFAAWIKLFKYLSFNKTMTQLSETLSAAAKDLSGFSVMFFIIYSAFVQLGYLLFGTQVRDFRSFIDSVYTLFRMILGDFNFRDIEKANTTLGPIYFLSYIFFVFFVLLNMFLAIINDTYGDVKAQLKLKTPDFQMSDFFKTGANNIKGWMGIHDRAVDVENAIKLAAADDGFVTYEELRENLRKARFSDTEIDLFFYHFQNDPIISQIILDEEEVKAKEAVREKRRMSMLSSLSAEEVSEEEEELASGDESAPARPRSGKEARRMRSARIKSAMDPAPEDMVPDDDFYNLQRRVDRIEASIAPLASNLDSVLVRVGATKKYNKRDMEHVFDQILQSDDMDAAASKYV